MRTRLDLHELLCDLLGSRNVYYQSPPSVLMNYPAIRYRRVRIDNQHANDGVYSSQNQYELTVIDDDPDSTIPDRVNRIPSARFIRPYVADNLNHWVFEIYY